MKQMSFKRGFIALGVVALVVVGASLSRDHVRAPVAHAGRLALENGGTEIAEVVDKVLPSVVNISTSKVVKRGGPGELDPLLNDPRSPFYQGDGDNDGARQRYGNSLGSGVIISNKGYVVTNNHVVSGADEITVTLGDGREFDAKLVGADPKSDVAVLKLRRDVQGLQPIEIGRSSDMRLGDVVLAIGNPFGIGQAVTMGIVSAKGRAGMGIVRYEDFIQTDAAINPGNSGGALINMKGQLIGINTAILSRTGGYQGIGFAIPTDMAMPITRDLIDDGKVERGWLGVEIRTLSPEMARERRIDDVRGILVTGVAERSPAARSGLAADDIITGMDGKKLSNAAQLSNAVALAGPGKAVRFDVMRDGRTQTVKVKLGDMKTLEKREQREQRQQRRQRRR